MIPFLYEAVWCEERDLKLLLYLNCQKYFSKSEIGKEAEQWRNCFQNRSEKVK